MKNYIVFDLEWNQSPQGKEGAIENIPFEIIEIGAIKLNQHFEAIDQFHQIIKPRIYSKLHFKISEVTHMRMEDLQEQGTDFSDVAAGFFDWCGEDYRFCTWGSMDLTEWQRNISYYGIDNPYGFPLFYYDLQKLFSILYNSGKEKPSLDHAVELLNIKMDRPFHRALEDAYYTGEILKTIDFGKVKDYVSVDYYRIPSNRSNEIFIRFPDYTKYVSSGFASKEAAMEERLVKDIRCFKCNRMIRKKIKWFSSNQKFYFCIAQCPLHGLVKGKIRLKKSEDGATYVVKTIKMADTDTAQRIFKKHEEIRKKRNIKSKIKKNKDG